MMVVIKIDVNEWHHIEKLTQQKTFARVTHLVLYINYTIRVTYLEFKLNENLKYQIDQWEEVSVEKSNVVLEKEENKAIVSINGTTMMITRPCGINKKFL